MNFEDEASDSTLARLAKAGDDLAFGQLVRRHKDGLYRLLRRHIGEGDEAYEAVHEAFIAAWKALGRFDPDRSFGAWLRTIAINKARDRGRRMVVRRIIFGLRGIDNEEALAVADGATPPDEAVIQRQLTQRLDQAIGQLPTALKEPLLLTVFEGMSQQEAGQILGLSTKTIETRVYRARKILAERLDADMRPGT